MHFNVHLTLYSIITPFDAFEISCIWNIMENGAFVQKSIIFCKASGYIACRNCMLPCIFKLGAIYS